MSAFIDIVRPEEKTRAFVFDALSVVGGSLFIALFAQLAIPLPFTIVPLTLQTLAVLLIGALLGKNRGVLAVLLYIIEGAIGLPFFAGGASGLGRILGMTGGYMLGFLCAAYLIGFLLERGSKEKFWQVTLAMIAGTTLILGLGALWLSFYVGGMKMAFLLGVLPFLAGEGLKIAIAASLVPSGWKMIRYFQ